MDPLLATIIAFASNFAPTSYAFCSGQLLLISSNTAVFSLLGTTYGGDGIQTFALPDLRGRTIVGQGQGPNLSPYVLGQTGGFEASTILTTNLPTHTHALNVTSSAGTTGVAGTTAYLANGPLTGSGPNATLLNTYTTTTPNTTLAAAAVGSTGSNIPLAILQPYCTISYIIALFGVFPSRN